MKMTNEERDLYCFLLDTPLVAEGKCPEWYTTLSASSRLRIAPWILEGVEADEKIRAFWKEKALTALEVEFWVDETRRKMPELFKNSFDPSTILIDLLQKKQNSRYRSVEPSAVLDS